MDSTLGVFDHVILAPLSISNIASLGTFDHVIMASLYVSKTASLGTFDHIVSSPYPCKIRMWDGTQWVVLPTRYTWNGSAWVEVG